MRRVCNTLVPKRLPNQQRSTTDRTHPMVLISVTNLTSPVSLAP